MGNVFCSIEKVQRGIILHKNLCEKLRLGQSSYVKRILKDRYTVLLFDLYAAIHLLRNKTK